MFNIMCFECFGDSEAVALIVFRVGWVQLASVFRDLRSIGVMYASLIGRFENGCRLLMFNGDGSVSVVFGFEFSLCLENGSCIM